MFLFSCYYKPKQLEVSKKISNGPIFYSTVKKDLSIKRVTFDPNISSIRKQQRPFIPYTPVLKTASIRGQLLSQGGIADIVTLGNYVIKTVSF